MAWLGAMNTTTGERPLRSQPESLRARSISVSLTATDFPKSLSWYTDVVGFTLDEEYKHEGKLVGATIKAGRVRLSLLQDDGKKGMDRKKGAGMRIYIATAQDVDGVANAIKERGGKLASEPADMPWGVRAFDLVDPDGFLLTIASET